MRWKGSRERRMHFCFAVFIKVRENGAEAWMRSARVLNTFG